MTFGIGHFDAGAGPFPGLVIEDRVHDLRPHLGTGVTTSALLDGWDATLPTLRLLAETVEGGVALDEVRPLPPVQPPGQIICVGANYHRHVAQIVFTSIRNQGDPRSDEELHAFADAAAHGRDQVEPLFFIGLPSALAGANDDVVLWGPKRQHDWELELAVVIGRTADHVSVEEAMNHVAGYTMSNDITIRDAMNRPDVPMTDFLRSKNRPTFFPTGPYLVPAEFVPEPRDLRIVLTVNGETMQDDGVDDMIKSVPELISSASEATVLSPGDLILTGSPAGNAGHHGNRWLRPGDVMVSTITGLGTQRNRCIAPSAR